MKKIVLVIGIAIGYVLGARAGRERYESLKRSAAQAAQHPKVQAVVDEAQAEVVDLARQATDKVSDAVSEVTSRAKSDPEPDMPPPGSTS